MKTAPALAALLAATSLPALLAQDLVPVPPDAPDAPAAPAAPAAAHDHEAWRARLTEPDFAVRAQALDEAAMMARHHPDFRTRLEAWATGDDALAWTCFLALREADQGMIQLQPPGFLTPPQGLWAPPHGIPEDAYIPFTHPPGTSFGPDGPIWPAEPHDLFGGADPFGPGSIFGEGPNWPFGPGGGLDIQGELRDGQGFGQQVIIGPDGVEVRVEEQTEEGGEVREYSAESLEALRAAHPELFEQGGPLAGMPTDLVPSGPGSGLVPSLPGLRLMPPPPMPPVVGGPVERTDVLGVMVASTPDEEEAPAGGLLVESVVAGTIAAHVGLEAGDLVIEVAGQRVRSADDVSAALAGRAAGAVVKVRWVDEAGTLETGTWTPDAD